MQRAARAVVALALIAAGAPSAWAGTPVDPTATLTVTRALDGAVIASFDAPVRGVSTSSFVVRTTRTGKDVSGSVACIDALGAGVSCAEGPVTTARWRAATLFVPGEQYRALVNPWGAATIEGYAGGTVAKVTDVFRMPVIHQEDSLGITYRWRTRPRDGAYGGSVLEERTPGAKAVLRFTGDRVVWYTRTGSSQGIATVTIDRRHVATIDNSGPDRARVARRFTGLGTGTHTLRIKVAGKPGASGGGRFVSVDAFRVDGVLTYASAAAYRWARATDTEASGGAVARSETRGSAAVFRFAGKGIDWEAVADGGVGALSVDGAERAVTDLRQGTGRIRTGVAGLTDARHTARLEVARARVGRGVTLDRFVVRLPSLDAFRGLGAWVDLWDYGLDPATAIADMAARGVDTLYLQTARWNSAAAIVDPDAVGAWLDAAADAGVDVVGWYLPAYDQWLDRDVYRTAAIASFRSPGGHRFDALAVDIEYKGETETLDEFNTGIANHLRRVRNRVGNAYPVGAIHPAPLGMAISPSSWSGFPWKKIGRYADVAMPMGYWSYRTDCDTNPAHCAGPYTTGNVERAATKTGLPVHIIGGIADEVTKSEVAAFVAAARAAGVIGGGVYDYRTTKDGFWASLAELSAA